MRARTARPGSWLAQAKPGRVFELSRKTLRGRPVRALVVRDPHDATHGGYARDFLREVDDGGCVPEGTGDRARISVRNIPAAAFASGLVTARVPELERFDRDDLEMIRYGIGVRIGGRLLRSTHGACTIPLIPGIRWTALWTGRDIASIPSGEQRRALEEALRGAWHFRVFGDGAPAWGDGPDFGRCEGYVTAAREPAQVEAIARALSAGGTVHRASFEVTARDEGDRHTIRAIGEANPLASLSGSLSYGKSDRFWMIAGD